MTDWPFVLAGYGVILGTLAVYAVALLGRLRRARQASLAIRRQAAAGDELPPARS